MAYRDLRGLLARLEELGELHRVEAEVDPELEIAAITDRVCKGPEGGKALLFQRVRGSAHPVVTNLFGSPRRIAAALGVARLEELSGWLSSLLSGFAGKSAAEKLAALAASDLWLRCAPVTVGQAPCQEVIEAFPAPGRFPLLRNWPLDGVPDHAGRFITLPLVVTRDPDGRLNCGMYRVAMLAADRAAIHWGAGSGAAAHYRRWRERGEEMPVAIAVGGDPAVTFAATLPLPEVLDEYTFAGLLRGVPAELARCLGSDLLVPAGAELVLEGVVVPGEAARDGAFGNHTGYYAPAEEVPLLRIKSISRRSDLIYPATVVGPPPMEDCWLAKGAERLLLPLLQVDLPAVVEICQPLAGIFHGATVVAITKSAPGQGGETLRLLWQTAWLGKSRLLVLVDGEQDPADGAGVYWRVLNEVDWERDLVVDGGRLGIDATRKLAAELDGRPAREPLRPSEEVERLVARRWREYGLE